MINMLKTAIEKTFVYSLNRILFPFVSVLVFLLLVFIPVLTTPGNNFFFQLQLLRWYGIVLVIFLSFSSGLLAAMQYAINREVKAAYSLKNKAVQTTTVAGMLFGALLSTLACSACYSSIIAAFGLGATLFIGKYRLYIIIFTVLTTFYAIYHSAKRLNNKCAACQVKIETFVQGEE
ncbi:hypothetical protein D6827_03680 [Candidatus Parcubacteria bacterium]|nr:MAG: hypothetical protein D6827_03680 [Candidatus Parcubacteria bacterium]